MGFLIIIFLSFLILFSSFFLLFEICKVILPFLFWGAIYVPTKPEIVEKMIKFADIKAGDKAADLGSGDGRLIIALAKAGAEAHGYEISPFLVRLAKKNIIKAELENKAFIHWKNLWNEDFSKFNIITIYGMGHMMKKLEFKLKKELKPGSRIISNAFTFPTWQPSKKEKNVYLYEQKV